MINDSNPELRFESKIAKENSLCRSGSISKLALAFVASLVVVIVLGLGALRLRPDSARTTPSNSQVRIYCASGIAKPVERLAQDFNAKYGTNVEIVRTGGSGELAGQIKTEHETGLVGGADLYVTADDGLLTKAHQEMIVAERFPLAEQKPVIAVAANSQFSFDSIADLVSQPNIRFGIASQQAAVGKLARNIATRDGVLEELESLKTTDAENVMTLALALSTGSLDAAIIWDTTVAQINHQNQLNQEPPTLKVSAFADPRNEFKSNIAIGVLSNTKAPTASLRFARFLTAKESGEKAFADLGFSFIAGDRWQEIPEIHLYCGSMFTPVLEESVREFAAREGVNIYPRWEGCGKLVASMQAVAGSSEFPDAFLACDVLFLEQVQEYFQAPTIISDNQIVMATHRETDQTVDDPNELIGSSLRIGICDPDQSALGMLTKQLLNAEPYAGIYEPISQQAIVQSDVGPTLISQLLAGGLDVVFVYRSNVLADPRSSDSIRIVELDNRSKNSIARQPWAISKSSQHQALMNRFFEWITRPEIKQRFLQHGFKLH